MENWALKTAKAYVDLDRLRTSENSETVDELQTLVVEMARALERPMYGSPTRRCACNGNPEQCDSQDHIGQPCLRRISVKRDPYCYPCDQ